MLQQHRRSWHGASHAPCSSAFHGGEFTQQSKLVSVLPPKPWLPGWHIHHGALSRLHALSSKCFGIVALMCHMKAHAPKSQSISFLFCSILELTALWCYLPPRLLSLSHNICSITREAMTPRAMKSGPTVHNSVGGPCPSISGMRPEGLPKPLNAVGLQVGQVRC